YAYTREAFGPLAGFLAGWALYLGEWVALPVFPLAFANYFAYFIGDSPAVSVIVKVLLVGVVTAVNVRGIQTGARLNDALTVASVVIALPTEAAQASQRPLADALASLLPSLGLPAAIGGVVMSAGALVSIAGVYDVFTLSLARLSYAMAKDGLFPAPFAKI